MERKQRLYAISEPDVGAKKRRRKRTETPTITLAEWTERLARELEKTGRERTARAYRGAVARFIRFLDDGRTADNPDVPRTSREGRRIELGLISGAIIGAFQIQLKLEGKALNTISFYMRMLRSIINRAVADGITPQFSHNIFGGVYTGVAQTKKRALAARELHKLAAFEGSDSGLHDALDLFMFCYHARGMSFVDMAYLKKSDISGRTIRYTRRKTGRTIELSVLPAMRKIIERFAERTRTSEYVFPIIKDATRRTRPQYESALRQQNARLKELGKLAGIDHRFSTHSARHSWATMARNYGLPLAVISEGLGHSSQKTTEIYLASIEQGVLDRASKLISDAILRDKKPRRLEKALQMAL